MSTPNVEKILVGLKATIIDRRRWPTHHRKILRQSHISHSVADLNVRENNVIQYLMDTQVKEIKALK